MNGHDQDSIFSVATLLCVYKNDNPLWIRAAIESVLSQNLPRVESRLYVCVDGRVPNEVTQVLTAYINDIFYCVQNLANLGLAASLNVLARAIDDERYVFRMDADDTSRPDRYRKQIEFLEMHPQVSVVGGAIQEFYNNVRRTHTYPLRHSEIVRHLPKGSPLAHPTVCLRATLLKEGARYPENVGTNEDVAFWFSLVRRGTRFANLSDVLLDFRLTEASYRRRGWRKILPEFAVYLNGLRSINRLSVSFIYVVGRMAARLLPARLSRALYLSPFREWFYKSKIQLRKRSE